MEFLDDGIKELKKILVGLNIAIIMSEIENQDLLDLIDLKFEWANKKKEKAKRH